MNISTNSTQKIITSTTPRGNWYDTNISAMNISRCWFQCDISVLWMIRTLITYIVVWSFRKAALSDITQRENNSQQQQCRHLLVGVWTTVTCWYRSTRAQWTTDCFLSLIPDWYLILISDKNNTTLKTSSHIQRHMYNGTAMLSLLFSIHKAYKKGVYLGVCPPLDVSRINKLILNWCLKLQQDSFSPNKWEGTVCSSRGFQAWTCSLFWAQRCVLTSSVLTGSSRRSGA